MLNRLARLLGKSPDQNSPPPQSTSSDPALLAQWNRDGYLILEGLFSRQTCDEVLAELDRYTGPQRRNLDSLITVDVLHGSHQGKCMRACRAPDEVFDGPFKINNLFVESSLVQRMTFAPPLRNALATVLGAEPLAINSLNFRYGSQQPDHIDSWYMPPPKANSMAVASICLEDIDPEAGPVVYYPGSHTIPPYVFSHGRIDAINDEMPPCNAYYRQEIEDRGLERKQHLGHKGDVLIWHCQLLHGGSPIANPRKTRSSLVVHYWGSDNVEPASVLRVPEGGIMLKRDYLHSDGAGISAA